MNVVNEYPLVSVLVPVFNHSRYVERCLESIKNDGWPRLDVIVIDDGSSDDSCAKVKEWIAENQSSFERVYFETQKNIGITKTLNKLIEASNGDFIVLVASDDYLLEGSIESRYSYLEVNPDYLAVFSDAVGVNDNEEIIFDSVIRDKFKGDLGALEDKRRIGKELILNWCVPGPVFMARKEAYVEVGLYNEKYFIEDRYFYLKLLAKNKLGFLNKTLAAYRLHSTSSTGSKARQIAVGLEVIRIERELLSCFSGFNRVLLQLQIWSNFSQLSKARKFERIFIFVRCAFSKFMKRALR